MMQIALLVLEYMSQILAIFVCAGILLASGITIVDAMSVLMNGDIDLAIQDGLFVLILLEMFFVARSFIRYGSINVGLIVNVGIIATVKAMIFRIDNMELDLALTFAVLFLSLGFVYWMEAKHYRKKKDLNDIVI